MADKGGTPLEEVSEITNLSASPIKKMTDKVSMAVRHPLVFVIEEKVGGKVGGSFDLERINNGP